jgi:hypothetical protein
LFGHRGRTVTEAEWLACDDPTPMLSTVEGIVSLRKLRLFMAGVCRCGWDCYGIPAIDRAIATADRFADGRESEDSVDYLRREYEAGSFWGIPTESLLCPPTQEMTAVRGFIGALKDSVWTGKATLAALLREVVGTPFHLPVFDPTWRAGTVVVIARQMYETREFSAMPILADALQDAGCDSAEILDHCRAPGPHVRGCWCVDLVLGKE